MLSGISCVFAFAFSGRENDSFASMDRCKYRVNARSRLGEEPIG
jgi:hypothetical protein